MTYCIECYRLLTSMGSLNEDFVWSSDQAIIQDVGRTGGPGVPNKVTTSLYVYALCVGYLLRT